jgi:hypothetical protein
MYSAIAKICWLRERVVKNGFQALSEKWQELAINQSSSLRAEFARLGYLYIPRFVDENSLHSLSAIWTTLRIGALRKEVLIEHHGVSSQRRMFTVSAIKIDDATREINCLYRDHNILNAICQITGESIVPLDDDIEKDVINWLALKGDQHGAHVDSFPFACSYVLDAPREDEGGVLIISHDADEALSFRGKRLPLFPGDLFFFRSDLLYHQVCPLLNDANRVVLNMAYATPRTKSNLSYSRNSLYT